MEEPALPTGLDRIELMQTFVRIVETGSLSAAAARMGMTQPTVSRRLQTLERTLGLKLLQRSTHVMKLTEDGERCFAHAKDLLDTWRAMQADLRGAKDEPEGRLRVLVPHAFGQQHLVTLCVDYLRRFPRVTIDWLLHDRQPDFIADGIDCAIHVGALDDPSLVAVRLSEVPRIVVAAPEILRSRTPPLHAADLETLPWLAVPPFYQDEVALTRSSDGATHRFGIRPRMSTDSLYAMRHAAVMGAGACIMSAWMTDEDIAQGRLVHIAPQWQASPLPIYLLYPPARFYPARLSRFLETIRQAIPPVMGAGSVEHLGHAGNRGSPNP
jgi:DNA-binding transcriptional LysR family regulator